MAKYMFDICNKDYEKCVNLLLLNYIRSAVLVSF